jgi:hypothetical protein
MTSFHERTAQWMVGLRSSILTFNHQLLHYSCWGVTACQVEDLRTAFECNPLSAPVTTATASLVFNTTGICVALYAQPQSQAR